MDDLMAARSTMAFSLGFHIIFAAIGMTMPFFMSASHFFYLRRGETAYLKLTKMWMKGVAILFAVGAVSGTVLSFELGFVPIRAQRLCLISPQESYAIRVL